MATKQKSYYGPLFWLALAAFVAPVLVAFQAFDALPGPYTKPDPNPDASGVDHALWDYLLKQYVENGLVDYDGLERDHLFATYVRQLGGARPENLATDAERLALYCNAYNAFVVHGVNRHGIRDDAFSYDQEGVGFFKLKEHILAGETVSLDHIEHQLIRAQYEEPRIHVALVCAARSCPPLRAEAFTGDNLERQLEDLSRQFANHPIHVRFDADAKTLHLSKILEWYGKDFEVAGGYLAFLLKRAEDADTRRGIESAQAGEATVVFSDYDTALNIQGGRRGGGGGNVDFGSGSIPNE
ncbi:MAG: DUF547 domain-containing protein [bacterium]|nr:DUF547 domain-containing protein [bacterium]